MGVPAFSIDIGPLTRKDIPTLLLVLKVRKKPNSAGACRAYPLQITSKACVVWTPHEFLRNTEIEMGLPIGSRALLPPTMCYGTQLRTPFFHVFLSLHCLDLAMVAM